MHHAVLIAGIVCAVAIVAGIVTAGIQGLAAWRAFRALRRTALRRLAELGAQLSELERRSARTAESAARLNEARARLQRTLELASVVTGGATDAWSLVGRVRGVVPRK